MTDQDAVNHLRAMRAQRLADVERCQEVVNNPARRDGSMRDVTRYRVRATLATQEAEAISHVLRLAGHGGGR